MRHDDPDAGWKRVNAVATTSTRPLILLAEQQGVCPRLLVSDWAREVLTAHAWHDKGALGMTFLDAPLWLREAFGVINGATADAYEFRRENRKRDK
jgi:hypothetical protein